MHRYCKPNSKGFVATIKINEAFWIMVTNDIQIFYYSGFI